MANAVYYFDFVDEVKGDSYRVEIWSKAVNVTPAINIKGSGTPLVINWRTVSDIFEPVITSEAVLEVISETDLYWSDFFTAKRGAWILKVYRNGTTTNDIIWQGQNVTESYSEPYLVTPYKSILKFSDLGDMDFIEFRPTSTTFYSGYKSLAEIILTCTNKLEFQLDALESTNIVNLETWNDATITEKSLLCNTFLDTSVFRIYEDDTEYAMTCMEVLKSVLKSIGCRMVQGSEMGLDAHKWHIQRIEEMVGSDALQTFGIDHTTYAVTVTSYTNNLARTITNGTNFDSPDYDITPVDQNQDLNISERYNKMVYKYTTKELFRKDAELLFNGKFTKGAKTYNNTSAFPKFFQVSSDITSSNACQLVTGVPSTDKDLLFRNYHQTNALTYMPAFAAAQSTSLSDQLSKHKHYIRTTGTESGDTADAGSAVMTNVQVSVLDNLKLKVKGSLLKKVDYSSCTTFGVNNENYITSELFHFGFRIKITYDNGHIYNWFMNPTYPGYGQNKWTVWNGTSYTVGDNIVKRVIGSKGWDNNVFSGVKYYSDKFEFDLDSAFFPENGIADFSFWVYLPRTEYSQYVTAATALPVGLAAVTIEDMSLQYVTDGDFTDDIEKNVTFITLTDAKENEYKYDVLYGDGPAEYCVSSFRYGVVTPTNQYKITSVWRKLTDASQLSAANIFSILPVRALLAEHQRVINGDYIGTFDIINTLNIDDGTDDKRYLILGDSWNVKKLTHSLTMQEITAYVWSSSSTSSTKLYNSKPTPSNSAKPKGSTVSSVFSGKAINNGVILTKPNTLTLQQIQTNYPG